MAQVIYIDAPQKEEKKKVGFTHYMTKNGWEPFEGFKNLLRVIYIGNCVIDGDMFIAYRHDGCIDIWKGHLNSGEY